MTAAMRFDLRRAPFATITEADQYAQCVEMARWADEHGFAAITISEHHGVDFIAAPTALSGVLLGATRNAHVMVNALLVPLHDPVEEKVLAGTEMSMVPAADGAVRP